MNQQKVKRKPRVRPAKPPVPWRLCPCGRKFRHNTAQVVLCGYCRSIAADNPASALYKPKAASDRRKNRCDAMPGTLARLEAYVARARRGEELFNPSDRSDWGDLL